MFRPRLGGHQPQHENPSSDALPRLRALPLEAGKLPELARVDRAQAHGRGRSLGVTQPLETSSPAAPSATAFRLPV